MIDSAIRQDLKYLLLACRPHQWIKNGIVFFPLFFGKRFFDSGPMIATIGIFIIFCLAASAGYLVNDIIDYDFDINHPEKSKRPFAAGRIGKTYSISVAIALGVAGLLLTFVFCRQATLLIAAYMIINGCYNLWLKHIVVIDLLCIAMFYLLRILSGAASAGVDPSIWIICCTVFLSIYLGLCKRYFDCHFAGAGKDFCRYYGAATSTLIIRFLAIMLFSLYFLYVIHQLDVRGSKLFMAAGTIAFVGGGIIRHLHLVLAGQYGGDAIMMLLKDRWLLLSVVGWFGLAGLRIYLP